MHDHPAIAALRKTQQQLRDTETELAAERAKTAALREQLRMLEATRQLAGRPLVPEQTAGECDATWLPAKPNPEPPDCEPSWITAARDEPGITTIRTTGGML